MRFPRIPTQLTLVGVVSACHLSAGSIPDEKIGHGFNVRHMDRSVAPGVDFGKFAAGTWLERAQIPADKPRWTGFTELSERNLDHLHEILRDAAQAPGTRGSVRQKVGDFFTSGIDITALNALGIKPIAAELAAIRGAKDVAELARLAAQMHVALGNPFLGIGVGSDEKQSDIYVFSLAQGGMSLPSKEYYFSEKFAAERWEFVGHIAKMFELAGETKAIAHRNAEVVFALEKALAENAKLPAELRDRVANYNKSTIAEVAKTYPGFPIELFVAELKLPPAVTDVVVRQPTFLEGLSKILQERPLDELKLYVQWNLLRTAAPYLSEDFGRESFRFTGTVLSGTPEQEPRWKRVTRVVDSRIGEALGQLYVAKHFPPASKARLMEMVGNLKVVLRERLQKLDWMSEPTRQKAVEKLDRFTPMIGYPEKWRDYSNVEIKRGDYFGNVKRATVAASRRQFDRAGQKVDKGEWSMTPSTVNAYFSPTKNQIVFPAGILQPPFFDPTLDDAVNYGAIGSVIGHEITHGFDDQGRRYDPEGNLTDWWAPEDAARFRERAQRIIAQYNRYEALPGLAVNGQLTLGENIADLGGTSIALEALRRSLKGKPAPAAIDGFTADQRFFISYAQLWRSKSRDSYLRQQVARDSHSPAPFRAVGPLVNQQEFFDAFGIKEGDAMWRRPEERANIW